MAYIMSSLMLFDARITGIIMTLAFTDQWVVE